MLGKALVFAAFGVICYYFSEYRAWIDFDRVLYSKSPGKCRIILENGGSEDFADLDEDTVLFSSGLSMSGSPGKIYALYTNGTLEEAKVLNTIDDKNPLRGPHGISIWEDPKSGQILLYVVIHEPTAEGVAVFEVTRQPLTLRYVKTIRDDAFGGFMNDLVVLDRDKFYITQSIRSRNRMFVALELGLSLPTGNLLYFDGKGSKTLKSYMVMPNGIAISTDKRTLYMSEFGRKRVHAFQIKDNGNIDTDWVADIGSGPDNIQVDPETGDLWIGAFPLLYRTLDVLNIFGPHQQVAQVLRVQMSDHKVAGIEEVFFNNGTMVTAASSALYKNKKLFIGTVTSQLVICDVHYLQD